MGKSNTTPQATVNIGAGSLDPGSEASLHLRVGDFADHTNVGPAKATAKVCDDGTVSFDGGAEGTRFWVKGVSQGLVVVLAATAKCKPERTLGRPDLSVKNREELKGQVQSQGENLAPPVVGMRSSATAKPDNSQHARLQASNRETVESAERTEKALKGQKEAELDSVDRAALAAAKGVDPGLHGTSGVQTLESPTVDCGANIDPEVPVPGIGEGGVVEPPHIAGDDTRPPELRPDPKPDPETVKAEKAEKAAARKRSERSKKAAATRKRNKAKADREAAARRTRATQQTKPRGK